MTGLDGSVCFFEILEDVDVFLELLRSASRSATAGHLDVAIQIRVALVEFLEPVERKRYAVDSGFAGGIETEGCLSLRQSLLVVFEILIAKSHVGVDFRRVRRGIVPGC